jgi:hypothetical protein
VLRQIGQSMPTLPASPVFEIENVAAGLAFEQLHERVEVGRCRKNGTRRPSRASTTNADHVGKFRRCSERLKHSAFFSILERRRTGDPRGERANTGQLIETT